MATLSGNGYILLGLAERCATCVVDLGSTCSSSGAECGSGTLFFSGPRRLLLSWRSGLCRARSGYFDFGVQQSVLQCPTAVREKWNGRPECLKMSQVRG